jgi:hypothetical protein
LLVAWAPSACLHSPAAPSSSSNVVVRFQTNDPEVYQKESIPHKAKDTKLSEEQLKEVSAAVAALQPLLAGSNPVWHSCSLRPCCPQTLVLTKTIQTDHAQAAEALCVLYNALLYPAGVQQGGGQCVTPHGRDARRHGQGSKRPDHHADL